MLSQLLNFLDLVDDFFWDYMGVPVVLGLGLYLSIKSQWFQVRAFPRIVGTFIFYIKKIDKGLGERGIAPVYAFFASIGGCIGVGNIVGVATAVQIGGPGAIFWMWVTGLIGMIIKYAEIYLGVKFRVKNSNGSYDGGPMIFLQQLFKTKWVPRIVALLLCVYGVEIYMFRIVTHSVSSIWSINRNIIIALLLLSILIVAKGGINIVGKISTAIMPAFLTAFCGMSLFVIIANISILPRIFFIIIKSAFTGHAAIGAFAGSSILLTMSQGVRRACYTGDLGVGYASIIHSETKEPNPERQAALGVLGIFLDTFVVCSLSVLVILITGVWKGGFHEDVVVASALSTYFKHVDIIWPFFVFLLGYSSLIAFFSAGRKAAIFLSPKYGSKLFYVYAVLAFLSFSFIGEERHSLMIMSIAGALLAIINLYGMVRLRDKITFKMADGKK
ncbi:sodium:alanine symporter family protein [Candidatus Babeliales bacterium]|nr:sodium:alanine symporter family protein [Candidatus Babeliales bacterium]